MFARVFSAAILGVEAYIVEVETDLDNKLPSFTVVGLGEGAVKESKERVSSAIKNSGYFPSETCDNKSGSRRYKKGRFRL